MTQHHFILILFAALAARAAGTRDEDGPGLLERAEATEGSESVLRLAGMGADLDSLLQNAAERHQARLKGTLAGAAADGSAMPETWYKVLERDGSKTANGQYGVVTFWKTKKDACGKSVQVVLKTQVPRNKDEEELAMCEVRYMSELMRNTYARCYFPAFWASHESQQAGQKMQVEILMERLAFELEDVLTGKQTFSRADVGVWIADIHRGLIELHAQSFIHRDIKGPNVMITAVRRAKIVDLGLACNTKTLNGHEYCQNFCSKTAGTPLYMPPEVLAGASSTKAHDFWSLGLLLGQLVAGRSTWPRAIMAIRQTRDNLKEAVEALSKEPNLQRNNVRFPEDDLPKTEALLKKWLSADPQDRSSVSLLQVIEWAKTEMGIDANVLLEPPDTELPPQECAEAFK